MWLRSALPLQVPLPNQEHNAIKMSWPEIGCWFWTGQEFTPEGYKEFLDEAYKHSAIRLLTTSIRYPGRGDGPEGSTIRFVRRPNTPAHAIWES